MNPEAIQISAESTPNPDTLKFNVNKQLLPQGSVDITDKDKAQNSPLAKALYEINHVNGVHIGTNFITITKTSEAAWSELAEPCTDTLKKVLLDVSDPVGQVDVEAAKVSTDPIEIKIKQILDSEIRPAVAQDGGDIVFHGYKDGVVTLHLQGACSSCPSSVMTLKMGVENRLKTVIPEIKEVVQI